MSPLNKSNESQTSRRTNNVLFLQRSHVKFAPPNQKEFVFFDECNKEIISLTSGLNSKTKVLFQATDRSDKVQFMLPIEKRILSIKLNSSRTVLAYHVEKSIIEFVNVSHNNEDPTDAYTLDNRRYVQTSRAKNSKLLGFLWTGNLELVMITDISIEYYYVDSNRRRLRFIKSFPSTTNWFVYQPSPKVNVSDEEDNSSNSQTPYSILMVSTGSLGNSMQPYMFTRSQIFKLHRFDVEGDWHGSEKLELFERSITIGSIYGQVRLLVLQHESLNIKSKGAQILLYTVDQDSGYTTITHTLDLDVSGRFAINILDNLVVVHDQPSKTSFIFDILVESTEKSDCPKHFVSLIGGQPIKPLRLLDEEQSTVEMYSLNWVFFQPNFIIDAKMGLLSTLHLNLAASRESIKDSLMLLNFLAHRKHSEQCILDECHDVVKKSYEIATSESPTQVCPLTDVSSTFEVVSKLILSTPEFKPNKNTSNEKQPSSNVKPAIKDPEETSCYSIYSAQLTQEDFHREVLRQLDQIGKQTPAHSHFVASTLMELIFSLQRQNKNVDFCINEQLLKCLMRDRRYYQIVQMIRSNIFKDSKQLACLLLSIRDQYPPASQLGLDMLHRLNCLTDLIESLNLASNIPCNSTSDVTSRLSSALHQSIEIDSR